MKKKIVGLIMAMTILAMLLPPIVANATTNIKIGDYIRMGTYYGEPILWRCVSFEKITGYDESGCPIIDSADTVTEYKDGYLPLLLSDKIICLKSFDANTSVNKSTGSHSRDAQGYKGWYGSNYWGDSNIRSWLNSTSTAGNIEWLCGNPPDSNHVTYNPYDQETGFLTNFTQSELNAIEPITQKSIVSYSEYGNNIYDTGNSPYHISGLWQSCNMNDIMNGYDDAYAVYLTDIMFLPDVCQIYNIYENLSVLGDKYYQSKITESCIKTSKHSDSSLNSNTYYKYWLRTPGTAASSYYGGGVFYEAYVGTSETITTDKAYNGEMGVRPAFYLNQVSSRFVSGSGTETNPYIVIGSDNSDRKNTSNIHTEATKNFNLTIYENKNANDSESDHYILSSHATVNINGTIYTTDKKGAVTIPQISSGSITVQKSGYIDKVLTVEQLKVSTKIYLQKEPDSGPVINGVWINDTDVYTNEYAIDITSTEEITLNADITWKNGSMSRIYLMQDSRTVDFSGSSLTTVLSDNFDVSSDIYIVAIDTNGNSTKKKLKFKVGEGEYKVSFDDRITGTIPNSIPVIGGGEVGLDIPILPITVTFEDNKFYGTIGFDVAKFSENYSATMDISGNYKSTYEKTNKYLFQNIKENFNNSSDSWKMTELKKKWKESMNSTTGTLGLDADINVIGFVEGYIDSNRHVTFLDGGIRCNPSFTAKMGSQILIWPPVYWEASLKGEIEAMLNLYLNDAAKNFTPRGNIGGAVTLKGGVGLGVSGVAGASGGAEGKIGINYDMYETQQNYLAITGSIGAYAKIYAGPVTLLDKSFPWASGTIWDYPSTRVNSISLFSDTSLYDNISYELIDRSYAQKPSEFTANYERIMPISAAAQNKYEQILKTNVYTYSEPQLAELGNGDILAVWLDDDKTRSAINRTSLYYSYYDGSWSEPQVVNDDRTADFAPYLAMTDDTVRLIWVNTKEELADSAELSDVCAAWEISSTAFNADTKTFEDIINITDDIETDMMPVIFGDGGSVYAAWVSNPSNDIFSKNNDYCIKVSSLLNGAWTEPTEYARGLYSVDSISGAVINGNMNIAYSVDMDGNLDGYSDKEIYLNNNRLTDNDILDSKVKFNGNKLYWYSDGNISEYNLSECSEKSILPEDDSISTDRFNIISNNGNKAIVFANAEGLGNELYAYMYDSTSDNWGNAIALTDLDSNISSFSGILSDSGNMQFIVNKTEITGGIESENPYGQTDLALFTVSPSYNLSVDSVIYAEDTIVQGSTVEFNIDVTNNGELTVDKYTIDITGDNVLASYISNEAILPGQTQEVQLYYTIEDEFVPQQVVVSVTPVNVNDFDMTDNTYVLNLTYEDITIENMGYGMLDNSNVVIYGNIVNRGYGTSGVVTAALHKDSADGEIVDTQVINDEIETLDIAAFSFTVPYSEGQVYYVTIDVEDMNIGNNSDFVVIRKEAMLSAEVSNAIIGEGTTDDEKQKYATGFITTISNMGNTQDSGKISWDVTSQGQTMRGIELGTALTLDAGAEVKIGLIIVGLYDENAVATVVIE